MKKIPLKLVVSEVCHSDSALFLVGIIQSTAQGVTTMGGSSHVKHIGSAWPWFSRSPAKKGWIQGALGKVGIFKSSSSMGVDEMYKGL